LGDAVTAGWTARVGVGTLGPVPLVMFAAKASAVVGSATTDPGALTRASDAAGCSQLGAAAFWRN
jgi:hypothetical protein